MLLDLPQQAPLSALSANELSSFLMTNVNELDTGPPKASPREPARPQASGRASRSGHLRAP